MKSPGSNSRNQAAEAAQEEQQQKQEATQQQQQQTTYQNVGGGSLQQDPYRNRKHNNDDKTNKTTTTNPTDQEIISATSGATTGGVWNDDSYSEEHFLSPTMSSLPVGGTSSWDEGSQSFDSELDHRRASTAATAGGGSRPSDRRKRFDTTTPTLVDEDEIPDDFDFEEEEEEEEIASSALDQSRDTSVLSASGQYAEEDTLNLRRTPGAMQMRQSSTENDLVETPAVQFQGQPPSGPPQGPRTITRETTRRGTSGGGGTSRGPFVFAPWASKNASTSSDSRAFSPNILRLTEDIGNLLHEDEDDDDAYAIEIPGVFRGEQQLLGQEHIQHQQTQQQQQQQQQEGVGNAGTTSATTTTPQTQSNFGNDWTGSYVFDQPPQFQPPQPKFARNRETRARRRFTRDQSVGSTTGGSTGGGFVQSTQQGGVSVGGPGSPSFFTPLSSTVQPRPTRSSSDPTVQQTQQRPVLFEFGKPRPPPEPQQQHQQPVNFGGAFVPPSQTRGFGPPPQQQVPPPQLAGQQMFLRPAVSAPVANASFAPNFQHLQRLPQPPADGPPAFGIAPPAFEVYPQQQQHGVHHPVPIQFVPLQPQPPQASQQQPPPHGQPIPNFGAATPHPPQPSHESQPTPQDFSTMQTRSSTPASSVFLSPRQQWQDTPPPYPINFDAQPPLAPPSVIETGGSWHSSANFQASPVPSHSFPPSGYGSDTPARSAATPSPHVPAWQPLRTQADTLSSQPPSTPVEAVSAPTPNTVPSSAASSPAISHAAAPSPDVSQGNRSKKEVGRRSIRTGRKKKPKAPEKSAALGASTSSKKKGKEIALAASVESNEVTGDEAVLTDAEDPADLKRAELEESPAVRVAFKDFYRAFRGEEKHSFQRAEELAQKALSDGSLPESIHWRVYLELADLARRSNRYIEARKLFQKVCELQPFASQGWIEYSKLEEDCGFMNRVSNILSAGLEYCEHSETLLTRAVKHQERMGNLAAARAILARLKHVGIDKVWRTVLEGALLEGRAGNRDMARRVLKYLMHHVPWYGPLYLEAYRLERDQGHPQDALQIVERGLSTLPRYGPLWFSAFRLYEEIDVSEGHFDLPNTMLMIDRARSTISKELVWKLHLEAAQMLERTSLAYVEESGLDLESYLQPVRRRLILTILTCPQNLRWKVWLAAGRLELAVGNMDIARGLFVRAHHCVQQKSKSATLLDYARFAEFKGDVSLARAILAKARSFYYHDWKVWFESALVEIRNDNHSRGYEIASCGLEFHAGSGRLWATLVQLGQLVGGDEMQVVALERALNSVPKSGEVWCEGARIHLNPFSSTFDLHRSRRYLHFAARFTPQFGDSFIESIRLEVLSQWLYPIAEYIWKKTKGDFSTESGGRESDNKVLSKFIADIFLAIASAKATGSERADKRVVEAKYSDIVSPLRKMLKAEKLRSSIDLSELKLACTNADPNYGSLWFHCRRLPMYTPTRVVERAAEDVVDDIFKNANIYLAAMIRRMAVLATAAGEMPQGADDTIESSDPKIIHWENYIDTKLRGAISLRDILEPLDPCPGLALLESALQGPTFLTALSTLNRHRPLDSMPLLERRRVLFGTDALFP